MIAQQNTELTTTEIEAYLLQHPEFFHEHLPLLENMKIPHPSGDAVSLISKQLELFRKRHHDLENQLTALIEIARDNDNLLSRMHQLTLAMLNAATLEDAIANLHQVLSESFLTDFSTVRIIEHSLDAPIANLFVAPGDQALQHFTKELSSNRPKCGRPTLGQARFLFGDAALEVKSCAIIPMISPDLEGIIAIGSREEGRFHYSMGNLFLTQMSEVIATRLISLIPRD